MHMEFCEINPDVEQALRSWHTKTKPTDWKSTSDVKKDYSNANLATNNRIIFNIEGADAQIRPTSEDLDLPVIL